MSILDIPWYDRPGNRLEREGVQTLSNSELLEILLGKGRNESVSTLVNRLLSRYNLNKLEELGVNGLRKECNNDIVPALKILSFIELSKRYNKLVSGGFTRKPITSAKQVYHMFADEMRTYKKEVLRVILLNTKNAPIKVKTVSEGTLNSSLIHPREVFKEAIKESANSIILVHNHPSGEIEPSEGDKDATDRIKETGKVLKINLIDHVIVGNDKYYSFRESNKL